MSEQRSKEQRHKDLIRRMIDEVWVKGNVDAAAQFIHLDAVDHRPGPGQSTGLKGMRQKYELIHQIFPDARLTIDDMIAEGDRVVLATTMRGTNTGSFMGLPPTGKEVEVFTLDLLTFRDGKIAEAVGAADMLDVLRQLGHLPEGLRDAPRFYG